MQSTESIAVAVGSTIRERRLDLRRTQEQVAEQAGIHSTYFGAIERGEKNTSIARLVWIARALDTTVASLLADVDDYFSRGHV